MTISGSLVAHCKICKCSFSAHMDNIPFVDAEVVGTCHDCFNKKSHVCRNEFGYDEDDCPVSDGSIEFEDEDGNTGMAEVKDGDGIIEKIWHYKKIPTDYGDYIEFEEE